MSEIQLVAILVAMIGVLYILARPYVGLVIFVGLLYTRPEEAIESLQGMRLTLIMAIVTVIGMYFQFFLNREKLVSTPLLPYAVGYLLIAIFNTVALDTGNTMDAIQIMGKLIILIPLVLNLIRTPRLFRHFISALLFFTGYLAIYSIYLYYNGGAILDLGKERSQATGIFEDPNDLAMTIVASVAFCLARAYAETGARRLLYSLLLGVYAYAILLTSSRSGLLAMLVVTFFFFKTFLKNKRTRGIAAAIAVLVVFVGAGARMKSFDSDDESVNQRFWFWKVGLDELVAHPLTGCGFAQFPDNNGGMAAHNTFVECFAEVGLPGYYCFIAMLYYAYRRRPGRELEVPPTPEEDYDVVASRLALSGYLTACWWLSRNYIPVLYILIALPMTAQLAHNRNKRFFNLLPAERTRDKINIGIIAIVSILVIRVMSEYYR